VLKDHLAFQREEGAGPPEPRQFPQIPQAA